MKEFVKKYWKNVVACIAFVTIFFLLFSHVQNVFELKEGCYGKYDDYNNMEKNSINVMFYGNSRTNRGLNPVIIDEISGTTSYNYGIQGLRASNMYFRFIDTLTTQNPQLIVLETSMYIPAKEHLMESHIQRTVQSLPFSLLKIKAALEMGFDDKMKAELIMPLLRFHGRFREIDSVDFAYMMDLNPDFPYEGQYPDEVMAESRGYMPYSVNREWEDNGKKYFTKDYSKITDIAEPDETQDKYFKEMVRIAEEHGAKVLLLSIPSFVSNETPKETIPLMNYLRDFYKDDPNVQCLDICTMIKDLGLGFSDYQNSGHLNLSGCRKLSEYIGNYIKENYSFK